MREGEERREREERIGICVFRFLKQWAECVTGAPDGPFRSTPPLPRSAHATSAFPPRGLSHHAATPPHTHVYTYATAAPHGSTTAKGGRASRARPEGEAPTSHHTALAPRFRELTIVKCCSHLSPDHLAT
ncbi:hypothetical protein CC85DRAFT_63472 [Cutaneotrichosporon oleaginosum]|uniref:Uncharacterized protein n=1 Tax=Cutaneotrichosporon oleaginosum TaxID=879819 RepID=A0A0J1B610_9TREE|nr:uncharacterized protein CC85DRAFT_63472 [Cutaneotrichosporon oleaginosum]KLT43164.1 hypothetical protein CC85DRAFT_63472 [Cutaneotrichosporon oleaginosum]TXT09846.1 hypothetical protein COLE_03780 [Cutaneotrichosporon oleaginosum]